MAQRHGAETMSGEAGESWAWSSLDEVAGGELEGTSDSSDEPDGTGGRLNGISRAHTTGRALEGPAAQAASCMEAARSWAGS